MSTHGRSPDAVLKNSKEFDGFMNVLSTNIERLRSYEERSYRLSVNDQVRAQKTDLPTGFTQNIAYSLESLTGLSFVPVVNIFEELETYDEMIGLSGALNTLVFSLSEKSGFI